MPETRLKIRLFGDPELRQKARPVPQITEAERDILSAMAKLMYASSGIGLAAPQVGIHQAMIVADAGSGLYKLVNPKIIRKEGHQVTEEGCLSIPGVCIKIKRAKKVIVSAEDEQAKPVTIEAQDLLACVFQHEIEHLKGRLIIDYASFFEKMKIKKRLGEIKRKAQNEGMPESKTQSCQLQL